MASGMRTHLKRITSAALLLLALGAITAALIGAALLASEHAAYHALATQYAQTDIDWAGLRSRNPDIAAWLQVEGTPIDYPVVAQRASDPDGFYLTHNVDRQADQAGCPYLSRAASPTGPHILVFGHHLHLTNLMFSTLHDSYQQERFDAIGDAQWSTPDTETAAFHPFCALTVDKTYQPIQRAAFADSEELRSWLTALADGASARNADADALATRACQVLTLVTCSDMRSGQRARTLMVFVRTEGGES